MGLETGTYVSDLNVSNPDGADLKSQGDDHLRLIKAVLKATFPNASRAFRFPNSLTSRTSAYTLVANIAENIIIPCNAASAAFTVTLPATPGIDGMQVLVIKTDATVNAVTISGNGNSINDSSTFTLSSPYQSVMLVWVASISRWIALGSATSDFTTGMIMAYGATSAPTGWVRCNARSIGNASSSATERANADTAALFAFLWTNYADAQCPVSGGRGASASADFAASKRITLPDARGRALIGLDTMGNSDAGRLGVSIDGTTNGAGAGTETTTLSAANMPNHTHSFTATSSSNGAHVHALAMQLTNSNGNHTTVNAVAGAATATDSSSIPVGSTGAHTHTVSGTTGSAGSGTAFSNLQPSIQTTWIMKL